MDVVPIRDFMIDAAEYYREIYQKYPDGIFISLHAVNRTKKHIQDAINILRVTENDSVFQWSKSESQYFLMEKLE